MASISPSEERPEARGLMSRLTAACRGPHALPAFGVVSFLESSLLPVPLDLILAPLCLARRRQFLLIVLIGTLGSVLGAILGYLIGAFFMETAGNWLLEFYGLKEQFSSFKEVYEANGWVAVAIAGITPVPFKVAAILSGAAAMRFDVFLAAVIGVRFVRFFLVTGVYALFGAGLERLLSRYSTAFTIVALVVTALGMLALPMLF